MNDSPEISNSLAKDLDYYIKHLESLYSSLPLILKLISATQKTSNQSFSKFLATLPKKRVDGKDGKVRFSIEVKDMNRFETLRSRIVVSDISMDIIPSSFLISLISHYDAFLGSLIRNLFLIIPEKLNSSEKKFSYSELLVFESIEKAKEHVIEKEVETVLRDSHCEQIKWLENKFDVKLRIDLPVWPTFIEITERRNLFVHSDGKVSSQYLKACAENNYKTQNLPRIGEKLKVDFEYFKSAFEILFEFGVKLTHVFWSKYLPKENEKASKNLTFICYNLICNEQYELAINLLEFAIKYLKNHNDFDKKVFRINLAQAYKWNGNNDKCCEVLSLEDWTASEPIFKLNVAVLKDDIKTAIKVMDIIGKKEDMVEAYQTWPLFKEFRKNLEFQIKFKDIYETNFVYLEYEDDSISDVKLLKSGEEV